METTDIIRNYLNKEDWRIKENSNIAYSLQGLNQRLAGYATAQYWLDEVYTPEISLCHRLGHIHLHDLGHSSSVYCTGWDLMTLLQEGFHGAGRNISSSPPRHLSTALLQACNFIYVAQGEAAGAVAFSNFDTLLAPFVRTGRLTYKQVKQALQEFIYNLGVPSRQAAQSPFSNLSLDLTVPETLKDLPAIVGGKPQSFSYKSLQREIDMINEALAEIMLEGDSSQRPFTFPLLNYSLTREFDWENSALEKLWALTAKYGSPTFSNYINSDMRVEDTRAMCCNLRLDLKELRGHSGGLFGNAGLTGSIGVVSINLALLGYLAVDTKDYYNKLENALKVARDSLTIKREFLEAQMENGLYPFTHHYLKEVKRGNGKYFANHFSTIGVIGGAEAALNLYGASIRDDVGLKLAQNTLHAVREALKGFQEETGALFNLEATPGEGACYRLAKKNLAQYPEMRIWNMEYMDGETPYLTNSTHIPVGDRDDIYVDLRHQDKLQPLYTSGTVWHVFIGEMRPDGKAAKSLVRKIAENFKLPFYTITPNFSICPNDGFLPGAIPECPKCKSPAAIYSRVVGYLRPVQDWNRGKRTEFDDRRVASEVVIGKRG